MINSHATLGHGEVVVKSFETGWIIPAQFRRPIVDKVVIEGLNIPGIAAWTLGPDEITGGGVDVIAVVGNNGTVDGIRVSWCHVLVHACRICHHEIIQDILGSARARKCLGLGRGKQTTAKNDCEEILQLGHSSGAKGERTSRRMQFVWIEWVAEDSTPCKT